MFKLRTIEHTKESMAIELPDGYDKTRPPGHYLTVPREYRESHLLDDIILHSSTLLQLATLCRMRPNFTCLREFFDELALLWSQIELTGGKIPTKLDPMPAYNEMKELIAKGKRTEFKRRYAENANGQRCWTQEQTGLYCSKMLNLR